jgi:2-C-methyl-D-erythritol 4-phosphate cytidylyltransferase
MNNHKTAAVLVCAGSGSRMKGACKDKLLLELADAPVVVHTLLAYDRAELIDLLVIVTKEELIPMYQSFKERYGIGKELRVTVGGATRMESVLNGVRAVPDSYEMVAIGDGARPLIRAEEIDQTVLAARQSGAAALGVYLTDTVKQVQGNTILRTVPRADLVGIQTPQVFRRAEYIPLAEKAVESGAEFTDDASIYEYFGKTVTFVEGRRDNMKITAPEDIPVLKAIMEERK